MTKAQSQFINNNQTKQAQNVLTGQEQHTKRIEGINDIVKFVWWMAIWPILVILSYCGHC